MAEKEIFLLDSSSFVTPFRFYYAFDLIPAYWERLCKYVEEQRIILLDLVRDEIDKGEDELTDWMHEGEFTVCNHVTASIVNQYQEILQYVEGCGYYTERALNAWSQPDVADPWLIAASAVNGYTLITDEVSAGTLSKKTPSKNAKIPDVAREFNVKTEDLYYMMRQLKIRI